MWDLVLVSLSPFIFTYSLPILQIPRWKVAKTVFVILLRGIEATGPIRTSADFLQQIVICQDLAANDHSLFFLIYASTCKASLIFPLVLKHVMSNLYLKSSLDPAIFLRCWLIFLLPLISKLKWVVHNYYFHILICQSLYNLPQPDFHTNYY